jgi:hypothetical protein
MLKKEKQQKDGGGVKLKNNVLGRKIMNILN